MQIIEAQDINRQKWQHLVEESPVASWFQTPEAYDFFVSLPHIMTPFAFAVVRDEYSDNLIDAARGKTNVNDDQMDNLIDAARGKIELNQQSSALKGVVVGYVTKDKTAVRQFFTRRAIIYGGPLLAEDITDEELVVLLQTLTTHLRHRAIYIETRNFSDYSPWRHTFEQFGFRYQEHYDMYIDCQNAEMMKSKIADVKRRQIRHQLAAGVELVEATSEAEVEDFYKLLHDLYANKIHKPLFPIDFFTTFVAQKHGVLLLAKQSNTVVGGMLCPILQDKVLYEWYVTGSAVVTWGAMNYANQHHISRFDLMGAGEPNVQYGVREFKLQFGGALYNFGRFLLKNNNILYTIGQIGVKLL